MLTQHSVVIKTACLSISIFLSQTAHEGRKGRRSTHNSIHSIQLTKHRMSQQDLHCYTLHTACTCTMYMYLVLREIEKEQATAVFKHTCIKEGQCFLNHTIHTNTCRYKNYTRQPSYNSKNDFTTALDMCGIILRVHHEFLGGGGGGGGGADPP